MEITLWFNWVKFTTTLTLDVYQAHLFFSFNLYQVSL